VLNNPLKYTDPSGNCIPDEVTGKCYSPIAYDENYLIVTAGLKNLGVNGNQKTAMEFVVTTEYSGTINNPKFAWPLTAAITRRYHSYCENGPWSRECILDFWGYMEGIVKSADPEYAKQHPFDASSQNPIVIVIANAILNPGGEDAANLGSSAFKSEWKNGGCGWNPPATNLCEWAVVNSQGNSVYYSAIYPPNGQGKTYPYQDPSTNLRYVMVVDNSHLLVVLSPNQNILDALKYGNSPFDYNITGYK
jgi:hypothetical protein